MKLSLLLFRIGWYIAGSGVLAVCFASYLNKFMPGWVVSWIGLGICIIACGIVLAFFTKGDD